MTQQVMLLAAGLLGVVFFIIMIKYGMLWIQSIASGAGIGLINMVGMSLRRVTPRRILNVRIMSVKAGIPIDTAMIEAHYLAKGNVERVMTALVAAAKAGITLTFEQAAAIDLAGRDVLEAVQTSVHPMVIDVPDSKKGRGTLDAVAKDGIQIKVRARVTVRTNLAQLVGGATEETIIARVGQGIVSSIGSCDTYGSVLMNPEVISKSVLNNGLDANTEFEIVSIDIADIDIGENVAARLRMDQAEADKRIAQALAEKRRAMAVAREQEMKALDQENRAKVTLSEASIPTAMAEAFRAGLLTVGRTESSAK